MSQNYDQFNIQDAMRLAQSDAGQRLLSLMRSQDSQKLQRAADQAAAGNYEKVKQTLGDLMTSPEVIALLKQMEQQYHE